MLRKSIAISFVLFVAFFGFCMVANADLKDGLVAYYPFNGNANDESGNGNNGTVYGATLTSDRFGSPNSAYDFVGTSGNSITTSFIPPNTFSISLWYNANSSQLLNPGIFSTFSTSLYNGIYYGQYGSSHETIWSDGNAYHTLSANANQWTHLVIISATSNIKAYKNGSLVLDFGGTTTHAANLIFGDSRFNQRYFTGAIDDIRIYNRALSEPEIQQLYLEGTNKPPVIKTFTGNPKAGLPPLTVKFECTAKDKDGTIEEYRWDFGDGEDNTTTKGTTSHSYTSAGAFNAKVTVVDDFGGETTFTPIVIKPGYGADLVGKMEQFTFDEVNHKVKMTLRVTNAGDSIATPFNVSYHLSNDGTTPLLPAFKVIRANSGLKPGKSIVPLVNVSFNDSIYGKYILILVDSGKEVTEIDETNNGTRLVIQPMVTK